MDTCNEYAASFIPRLGTYFSCVLEKGHDGEHRAGGECFTHGKYVMEHSEETPKCPKCEMERTQIVSRSDPRGNKDSVMQSEFHHQWEPDFSEGEPDPKDPTCGVCGRVDDLYHFKRPEFKKKNLSV